MSLQARMSIDRQYKHKQPKLVVVWEVGDFWEAYGENAETMHELFDIDLFRVKSPVQRRRKITFIPYVGFQPHEGQDMIDAMQASGRTVMLIKQDDRLALERRADSLYQSPRHRMRQARRTRGKL